MKTLLLFFGALFTACACDAMDCCAKVCSSVPALMAAEAEKVAKPPAPAPPVSPTPKRHGKERGSRPAPPSHLFM